MTTMTAAPESTAVLESSYAFCQRLTKKAARNFYYGLKLLPEEKRRAMFTLYAYMRLVDDIADAPGRAADQRLKDLELWRLQTNAALAGQIQEQAPSSNENIWPAFSDMARRHAIPPRLFEDMIAGQRQDLHPVALENFDDLSAYCYRVAGVVGLASIYVWGFQGGAATEAMAIDRGAAFQLTNILRDLREDLSRGRLYLPLNELQTYGLDQHTLLNGSPRFAEFMQFQIDRAQSFYDKSASLEDQIERDSRPTLLAMTRIYHGLLKKIARRPERVLHQRVSLSLFSKLRIGWQAMREK